MYTPLSQRKAYKRLTEVCGSSRKYQPEAALKQKLPTPCSAPVFSVFCLAPLSCLVPAGVHCDLRYSALSLPYHGAFDSDADRYIIDQISAAVLRLPVLH
ncbi:hypothetical protein E5288_WYG009544 [Bos mutus]|uniref:Uncharacterized protein n=1 Tax=Bos mutus TaxID=72004 RepID=A0A6B0RM60_9CETA|nr:hypothetical protein [Bos mutus]